MLSATRINEGADLMVSLIVRNTGERAGKEVLQLYVKPTASTAFRPVKELKAFTKVDLQPGEEKEIHFELDRRAFAHYSTSLKDWQVETGEYQVLVGASSEDIRCQEKVWIESSQPEAAILERDRHPSYHDFPADAAVTQADFEFLIEGAVPENLAETKGTYTLNTPVGDLSGSWVGRWFFHFLEKQIDELVKDDPDGPNALMMREVVKGLPLRALALMGGERVNRGMLDGLLDIVNGRFFKGLIKVLRANQKQG